MSKSLSNGRDGIRVDARSTGNMILGKLLFLNGEHDAHDDSLGFGRAGTANFWWMNIGGSESRPGLLG